MAEKNKLADLEKSITRYYDQFLAKRLALAAFAVGLLVLVSALAAYWALTSGLLAACVGFVVGFIGINLAFITIVPPSSSIKEVKQLIFGALREPARIKSYDMKKVKILDAKGRLHTLKARELRIWTSLVVPYLIHYNISGDKAAPRKVRTLTASERKYIEQRRQEVLEMEQKIKEERESLERDREEIEMRGADLKEAEEMVIARLTGIERAEAEIEQLKLITAERADAEAGSYDAKAAEAKAEKLREKEKELSEMKERLAEERQSFEQQKADMDRLKTSVTRSPFVGVTASSAEQSVAEREAALEARQRELEAAACELEKRADFVADSENSLIERLDALSHREATIEQGEIEAGIRED
jgi:hypothetical protein